MKNGIHLGVLIVDDCKEIDMIQASPPCVNFANSKRTLYVITGKLKSGKRFKPIHTHTPQHYNIWSGTIWEILPSNKRKLIKRFY